MQAGLETFNQQPCSPESCHSVTLAKVLLFGKAAPFFAKRSLQQSHFRDRKHIGFLDSKKWSFPVALKLAAWTKPTLIYLRNVRASCFEQVARFHTAKNGIATHYRFSLWTEPFRGCFQFLFNSRRDQKRARQIHALERVAILFFGCDMTLGTHPAASKVRQKTWNHRRQEGWHTSTCWTGEDRLWESKFEILFQPKNKNGHQTNRTVHVTSSCACCGFLRSRLESQSWNSFNPFPIVNRVSAGVPTPPDSGKTPQLKTSKLAQNCGKIEVLHLQPSYGICWSHEIETLPAM